MTFRVLVIGGYGTFGSRLVRLLADDARFEILVAGRSAQRATAFCGSLAPRAKLIPTAFDRTQNVRARIAALAPHAVVDASGPFQAYGSKPFAVVKACLDARAHYLDLADAAAFVEGVTAFDPEAKAAGVAVISGASTLPALSTAVLRRLTQDLSRVDDVSIGIAPSPRAPLGLNVVRAVSGYAGKPLAVWREGRRAFGYGMMEGRKVVIAPSGAIPLQPRWFALAEGPDLVFAPRLWPGLRSVWTAAGTAPVIWQRLLGTLAWLVRHRALPTLSWLAPFFHWVRGRVVWGEDRGGMFVDVTGEAGGVEVERQWHMVAEGESGPFVPALASCALLRKWVSGELPRPGARACTDDLGLADFEAMLAALSIKTAVRERRPDDAGLPLYRRILGSAWDSLPEPIRAMHDGTSTWRAEGRAAVERGSGIIARVAAFAMRLPKAGDDVPVRVEFTAAGGQETWTRDFAGTRFSSVQYETRDEGLLQERFGPFRFAIALMAEGERLRLVMRGWSLVGVALPRRLGPRGDTYEHVGNGRFRFHVEIGFPWSGLIVRYRGWLERTRPLDGVGEMPPDLNRMRGTGR